MCHDSKKTEALNSWGSCQVNILRVLAPTLSHISDPIHKINPITRDSTVCIPHITISTSSKSHLGIWWAPTLNVQCYSTDISFWPKLDITYRLSIWHKLQKFYGVIVGQFWPLCMIMTNKQSPINNNKRVYRQSQVRKPNGSEVKWAECSLIIGTGCWVQVFSLILDSTVGLWVGIQFAGE